MWINEILFSARARSFLVEFLSFSRFWFFAEFTSLKHFAFRRISRAWSHHWKAGEGHRIHWRDDTSFFWLVKVTEYFFEPCWRETASLLVLWTHSEGMRHAYRNFGDFTVREHQRQASIIRFFAVGAATIDKGAALSEGTNWMEISLLDARCDSMWFDVIRCDSVWLNSPRTIVSCRSN